ncbi:UNVERIFIED_CONTAM: flagellar hook protein FliD, partial [Salmonella enterica subsp. enterica serovar Weltevreden]
QRLRKTENETRTQISALGALRSALSSLDATLKKFEGTGGISSRKATVGDGAGFAASASNSAAVGEYQVEVERLASA